MSRENTSSGKANPQMEIGNSGVREVAKVMRREEGKGSSKSGGAAYFDIPLKRDQSKVK